MALVAEILTTGDELLRGDVVNTNATWLATRLWQLGLPPGRIVAVGDELESIVAAVREASARADVIVVSGGLGPTDDDRTTAAIARTAGVELELDRAVLEQLRARFARAGYTFTPNNEKQARFPRGALVLPNDAGTAPGFLLRLGPKTAVACLPGVPHEMRRMFDERLAPLLAAEWPAPRALVRSLNLFGLGESQMDYLLRDLTGRVGAAAEPGAGGGGCAGPDGGKAAGAGEGAGRCEVRLHTRTSFPENRAIIEVRPPSREREVEARELLARLESEARALLGPSVFGSDETTFSEAVGAALRRASATVALAESCSGGLAADLLTQAPGASEVFEVAVVAYSNRFKSELLGVPAELLLGHGAVSRQCVEAMATGVRALAGATYGLAISGIAGPGGGTADEPVGTVHFGLAWEGGLRHVHRVFPFERQRVKLLAAYVALAMLSRQIGGEWPEDEDVVGGRWSAPA